MYRVNFILHSSKNIADLDHIIVLGESTKSNKFTLDMIVAKCGKQKVILELVPKSKFSLEVFQEIYENVTREWADKAVLFVLMDDIVHSVYQDILRTYFGIKPTDDWPKNIVEVSTFLKEYVP